MSNSWKAPLQQATQSGMTTVLGLLKSGKLILRHASDRGDETFWRATREVRPGFSHEETLHDGTAQSVMNEETPRDRPGRPDINFKKRHGLNNSSLETMKQDWNCQ